MTGLFAWISRTTLSRTYVIDNISIWLKLILLEEINLGIWLNKGYFDLFWYM